MGKPFNGNEMFEKMREYLDIKYIYDDIAPINNVSDYSLEQLKIEMKNFSSSIANRLKEACKLCDVKMLNEL
jgi:hypothetical protein